jgi:hypothetical protein
MGLNKYLHESDSQLSRNLAQFTSGSHSPGSHPSQSSQMLQLRHRCQTGAIQSRETHIGSGKVIQGLPKALGLL